MRTTNDEEGENIALLYNNLQHQPVFQAINTVVARCSKYILLDHQSKMLVENKVIVCV
jgi:hypothetical protein